MDNNPPFILILLILSVSLEEEGIFFLQYAENGNKVWTV